MKGALIVGIDNYPGAARLQGCISDATEMAEVLETNGDGSRNFHVTLQTDVPTRAALRAMICKLFQGDLDTALFYFSGHGCSTERGGFLITPDFKNYDEGISMDELLSIVNRSHIKNKIIIIDCCHSGVLGNPNLTGGAISYLGDGVTIMTSSRGNEQAIEVRGHGVFTYLLLEALRGGAADLTGNITPGSLYAYVDRALGMWQQRPQFKINVSRFTTLRTVSPVVSTDQVLRKLTTYFPVPEEPFLLDPSFEHSNTEIAVPEHVLTFSHLQQMHRVGLVMPVEEEHMYYAAQNSKSCALTPLGRHYWLLVKEKRI